MKHLEAMTFMLSCLLYYDSQQIFLLYHKCHKNVVLHPIAPPFYVYVNMTLYRPFIAQTNNNVSGESLYRQITCMLKTLMHAQS